MQRCGESFPLVISSLSSFPTELGFKPSFHTEEDSRDRGHSIAASSSFTVFTYRSGRVQRGQLVFSVADVGVRVGHKESVRRAAGLVLRGYNQWRLHAQLIEENKRRRRGEKDVEGGGPRLLFSVE